MKTEDDIEIALVSNVNDQGSLVNQSMSNSLDKISQSLENLLQPTRKILNFSKRQISEQTSLIQQADTITKRLTNMLDNITRRAKEVEEKGVRCDMQAMQAQVNQIKCSMIELLNNKVFQKLHDLDIAFNDGNAERSTANIDFSKDILSQLGSYLAPKCAIQ
jgi:flagellin-specific chaperone FliS